MLWLIALLALAVLLWGVTRLYLDGEDLSRFDAQDDDEPAHTEPSPEHHQAVEAIRSMQAEAKGGWSSGRGLAQLRERVDEMGAVDDPTIRYDAADADGVAGEWVRAPGADADRRLLYIHGGAYMVGSHRSHRPITTALARLTGAAVLAVDYRLMPEHRRLDGIEDCRRAYAWIIDHGPEGPAPVQALFMAGDSAGGNLTLATAAWARDAGKRRADAVVALSPHTDACMASPSLRENIETDHMLGPMFSAFARIPRRLALWTTWWTNRMRPSDPRISPLRGDLSGLPPTLVHASRAEMLLDDARRWVNRARAAGTDARLHTWHHQLHVWHIFEPTLPEAREALADIADFIEAQAPREAGDPEPERARA